MNIEVGKIIKTVGLKGEMKIYPLSDDYLLRFKKGEKLLINGKQHTIISFRLNKQCPVIKVSDIESIDQVEPLIGTIITIDSSWLPPLGENEYYGYQLKGFKVKYNDKVIGTVIGFETYQQLNVRIQLDDGTTMLLPYFGAFKQSVDVERQEIVMANLEGLL